MFDYQKVKVEKHRSGAKSRSYSNVKLQRELIKSYCGHQENVTLFSTTHLFDIEFEMSNSLGHEEYADDEFRIKLRKGFKAYFKFSKNFADLSFITGSHITGTSKLISIFLSKILSWN